MYENKLIKIAAAGFIGMVVLPGLIKLTTDAGICVYNCIQKHKHNKKIKEGLKNGSIVEINGEYYEVEISESKKDEFED